MPSAILERLTSWLGLLLGVCTAVLPPQGLVLCVEVDGCVSVELAAAQRDCGGCEGHAPEHGPASGASQLSRGDDCPCVDVPVPGSAQDQRLPSRGAAPKSAPLLALPLPARCAATRPALLAGPAARDLAPRPPDLLRHLASIVLLV